MPNHQAGEVKVTGTRIHPWTPREAYRRKAAQKDHGRIHVVASYKTNGTDTIRWVTCWYDSGLHHGQSGWTQVWHDTWDLAMAHALTIIETRRIHKNVLATEARIARNEPHRVIDHRTKPMPPPSDTAWIRTELLERQRHRRTLR